MYVIVSNTFLFKFHEKKLVINTIFLMLDINFISNCLFFNLLFIILAFIFLALTTNGTHMSHETHAYFTEGQICSTSFFFFLSSKSVTLVF